MNPLLTCGAMAAAAAMFFAFPATAGHHAKSETAAKKSTIVDVAASAGQFNTLITALKAASLTDTLRGDGPFTVFAPTDEAFAALPEGALQSLLDNPEKLAEVLTLHVVPGRAGSADVVKLASVTTVQGQALDVGTMGGVTVGGAKVVKADIDASNGVIHVIDRVLLPRS